MILDVIKKVREKLKTIKDFKGVYVGEQLSVVDYPICWIEAGYGRRGTTTEEREYISGGQVWDEIYTLTIWVEILYEDTEENAYLIYKLVEKVKEKIRESPTLDGLIYDLSIISSEYPLKVEKESLLRVAPLTIECISRKQKI
jgi:hypothetical protein